MFQRLYDRLFCHGSLAHQSRHWFGSFFFGILCSWRWGGAIVCNHDFVIFDPARAPNDRKTLRDWCRQQLEWDEAQNGDVQHVASEALLAWHVDMAKGYQVPWGPVVRMVSCRLAETAIHVSFSRTKANDAQRAVADLAHRHSVGFVVTSSPCQEVWLPHDHYMGLTMQLRPKTIDASDILNARAWQRGLNSFIVALRRL